MKAKVRELKERIDRYPGTAEFLQDVVAALEHIYADDPAGCPAGFSHLDAAVNAFAEAET